jgi:hypothetical protein
MHPDARPSIPAELGLLSACVGLQGYLGLLVALRRSHVPQRASACRIDARKIRVDGPTLALVGLNSVVGRFVLTVRFWHDPLVAAKPDHLAMGFNQRYYARSYHTLVNIIAGFLFKTLGPLQSVATVVVHFIRSACQFSGRRCRFSPWSTIYSPPWSARQISTDNCGGSSVAT